MQFLRAASCGSPRTISPNFRLGVFGFSVRRLCDLGAMTEPRVIKYQGKQVWDAHWINPANLKNFQSAPMLQYRLFTESIKDYFSIPTINSAIGKIIDNCTVTLSGALMVAHRAGLPGFESWMNDSTVRRKFADNTTAFFERANGIF
jgi:hypothetical protein